MPLAYVMGVLHLSSFEVHLWVGTSRGKICFPTIQAILITTVCVVTSGSLAIYPGYSLSPLHVWLTNVFAVLAGQGQYY